MKKGMGMTLHRCVDLVPKLDEAIECAIKLGFERILTSGMAKKYLNEYFNIVKEGQ